MKKLFVTCALIVSVILIAPGTASAQATGQVDVAIDVNGFVILYYYDDIDITIPSNVMAQALAGADLNGGVGSGPLGVNATSSGVGTLTALGTVLGGSSPTMQQTLTIQNAWSVRGLTNNGVDVTVGNFRNLTHTTAGSIAVTGGGCAPAASCLGINPTLGAALSGNVELDLDFTNVSAPEVFRDSAAYTITATILP